MPKPTAKQQISKLVKATKLLLEAGVEVVPNDIPVKTKPAEQPTNTWVN